VNRKLLRTKVGRRLSWRADIDADSIAAFNEAINDAQKKLAGDCPSAFMPDEESIVLYPDYTNGTMGRTLAATTDPYVLTFGASPGAAGTSEPVVDGTWDGIYHLEITDPTGQAHRRQTREFWKATVAGGPAGDQIFVSLDRPWRNSTDSGMAFRLHQPEFFFRDDVMEVLDGGIWDQTGAHLVALPEHFMRFYNDQDYRGNRTARPEYLVRGRHFQLDAPLTPPLAVRAEQLGPWVGREPIGRFRFMYTYASGKKDAERQSPVGGYDPMWESSPSPASEAITLTDASQLIQIKGLPNIDYMQDFDPIAGGTLRAGRSGVYKRLYVIRETTDTTGAFVDEVEPLGVPMFLGNVEGNVVQTTWDGSVIPVYTRRLPEVQGYFAHRMVPHQNQRYEVDFRVRRRPRDLGHDGDAPRVHPDAEEALVLLCCYFCAKLDKQYDEADKALEQYTGSPAKNIEGELPKFMRQHGNPVRVIPGGIWTPPGRGGGSRRQDPNRYNYFKA